MRRAWKTTLIAGILTVSGCAASPDKHFHSQMVNKPAPDFELKDLGGATVKLSQFRGKPVVLAFFAFG